MTKPFTWSYSKLKHYETCPRKYHEVDVLKNFKEEESEALTWGHEVHSAAENFLKEGKALPPGMPVLQSWLDRISAADYDDRLVELKLAITEDFTPCSYWDRNVWFRTVCDFLGIKAPVGLALDWKTGKLLEDSQQLALMSACCFAHFPQVQKLRTEFIWLKEGKNISSRRDFNREDMVSMWRNVWPRIEMLKLAHEKNQFPPRPGGLCQKWCPVSSCEYHGNSN